MDNDEDGFIALEDCDDEDQDAFPGATEVCDGVDQDCDGRVDDDAEDARTWYADSDGDGHGDPNERTVACDQPASSVSSDDDCDDGDASSFPGAAELPYDGVDQDCDGADVDDVDGDGHAAVDAAGDDCDDTRADVHPGAAEVPYDGVDQDCSGDDSDDLDGDGFAGEEAGGGDCDDQDPAIAPGAGETWADGMTDNDCDGELEDAQLDYGAAVWIGESAGGELGRRVAALGDVDGDGLAEYLASAILEASAFPTGGAVYLLGGSGSGTVGGAPKVSAGGEGWYLGSALAGGHDVDGDGVVDFAVSATGYDGGAGRTWVISGAGLQAAGELDPETAAIGAVLGEAGSVSGLGVAFVGDLDGTGSAWLAVSAPFRADGASAEVGSVALFRQVTGEQEFGDADRDVAGYYEGGHLGGEVAAAGDQDGDGLDDFMVATDSGDVALIVPGGNGAPTLPDDAVFRLTRSTAGAADREDVQVIGDVDGDGRQDLAVIHEYATVCLFTNLVGNPVLVVEDATATVALGDGSYAYDTADLGDLDSDGLDETLVGEQWDSTLGTSVAWVWPGEWVTRGSERPVEDAHLRAVSTRTLSAFGYRVATSDDVDGDGSRDILVGGYQDDEAGADAGGVTAIPVPD